MKRIGTRRGSVVVEGVFIIFLVILAVALNLELVRRAFYEVLLHHGSFLIVRGRALGKNWRQVRRETAELLEAALGISGGRRIFERLTIDEAEVDTGLEIKIHFRYPAFLAFPYRNATKHHFELTKKCKFPFS